MITEITEDEEKSRGFEVEKGEQNKEFTNAAC